MSDIAYEAFARRRGTQFRLHLAEGRHTGLALTDCTALSADGSTDAFSLTFLAAADAPAEQATYLISAEGLGPEPVFLVPVGRRADGVEYQAVFNRLPRAEPADPEEATR